MVLADVDAQVAALFGFVAAVGALVGRLLAAALHVLVAPQRRLPAILLAAVPTLKVLRAVVRLVGLERGRVLDVARVLVLNVLAAARHAVHRARLRALAVDRLGGRRALVRIQLDLVDLVVGQLAHDARLQLLVRDLGHGQLRLGRLLLDDELVGHVVDDLGDDRRGGRIDGLDGGQFGFGLSLGHSKDFVAELARQREVQQLGLLIMIVDDQRGARDRRHHGRHRMRRGLAGGAGRLLHRIFDARMIFGRLLGHAAIVHLAAGRSRNHGHFRWQFLGRR